MNLKAPIAWKTNSLDSHPWVLRQTSTECMQYGVHLIPNGYSGRREKENGIKSYSFISSKSLFAGGVLTNKSLALTLVSTTLVQ